MKNIIILLFAAPLLSSAQQQAPSTMKKQAPLTCKLTSKELQERKVTILASLKKQIIQKQPLSNGYAYKFSGSDAMIDELSDFIKTERQCCDFFDFSVQTKGDGSVTWLHITGPPGAQQFITSELGL